MTVGRGEWPGAPVEIIKIHLVLADVEAWAQAMRLAGADGQAPAYCGEQDGRAVRLSGWPGSTASEPKEGQLTAVLTADLAAVLAAVDIDYLSTGSLPGLAEKLARLEDAVGRAGQPLARKEEDEGRG